MACGPGSYLVRPQQGLGGWAELAEGPVVAPSQHCKIKEACEGPGNSGHEDEQLLGLWGRGGSEVDPSTTASPSPGEPLPAPPCTGATGTALYSGARVGGTHVTPALITPQGHVPSLSAPAASPACKAL